MAGFGSDGWPASEQAHVTITDAPGDMLTAPRSWGWP
jgi:hypothetical protein